MAPEHNMTDVMKSEPSDEIEAEKPSSPQMADKSLHQQDGTTTPKQTLQIDSVEQDDVFNETDGLNSNRTESTATDDSGIAAEFDYQNLLDNDDNECVLGNSQNNSLKASTSCFTATEQANGTSTESSPTHTEHNNINGGHVSRTPTKTRLSTEDESNLSPRQRWWSPHRALCSESLESIAEEKRKRSKGDIGKRTAWLKERTDSALEKSALVRKRSAELIQTGKRLRNEQM
ncbi:uncharacterized protein [Amphiura filiformis]|uniref:uncharacterized protein n=1 Tax=Amphiura filiformis TaxID=82378 RepID=UPI003B21ECCE